jgi:hypothetical protein
VIRCDRTHVTERTGDHRGSNRNDRHASQASLSGERARRGLVVEPGGLTVNSKRAYDSGTVLSASPSLAAAKTHLVKIDPTITSAP